MPEYYTFWDLHVAIQDAMGWLDYHLHEFYMTHPVTGEKVIIGVPDEEDELFDRETLPDDREKISDWFSMENRKADYTYDFGDNWTHSIVLEDILPQDRDRDYPLCIAGKRACPPEDCGGTGGYELFLEAISNPRHERHKELLEWAGGKFDPEQFDPREVHFDDPDERRKLAFE